MSTGFPTNHGGNAPPVVFPFGARFTACCLFGLIALWITVHSFFLVLRYQFGMDHVLGIAAMFDLWTERSLPTWYSSATLLLCAALLWIIGHGVRHSGKGNSLPWHALSLLFVFVSADELVGFHERLIVPIRQLYATHGVFRFAWLIPYGTAFLILTVIFFPFYLRLPRMTQWHFALSALMFLGGAVGMEMIGGVVYEAGDCQRALPIDLCNAVEESLEMFGVATFLYALLRYLEVHGGGLAIRFQEV